MEISPNDFQGADLPRRILHGSVANGIKIAALLSVQRLEGSQLAQVCTYYDGGCPNRGG